MVAAVAVTTVPWLLAVGLSQGTPPGERHLIVVLNVWLGVPHVATTIALYADRELRPMMREPRYWSVPLALVTGCAALAATGRAGMDLLLIVNSLWALHHFAKQNLGMVAFTQRARREPGPSPLDRRVIVATGIAAMFGFQAVMLPQLGYHTTDTEPLRLVGAAILAVCGVMAWRSAARGPMLVAVLFFTPLFLGISLFSAVVAYGAAHGAQYLLMTGTIAKRGARTAVVFVVSLVAGGWLLRYGSSDQGWLYGAVIGATLAHFVIDAGVWKMTTPEKRDYMRTRFTFL